MSRKRRKKRSQRSKGVSGSDRKIMSRQVQSHVRAQQTSGEFNPDYTHVIQDLKRIGMLAGSFIVLLIILSIFLR